MYRIWFFLLVIFLPGCSTPNSSEEGKEREMAFKNHIKKITEFKTILNLGGIWLKEQVHREKFFDKNGFKFKEITHYDDGSIENIISLQYDKNGNLIFRKAVNPDSSVSYSDKRVFDEHNNKIEYYFYNPDSTLLYRKPAVYDKEGKMIESRMYHDGEWKATYKYKYQDARMTENNIYDSTGNFKHKWLYVYDNRNNLIEEVQYNSQNYISYQNKYEYTKDNFLIKETNYVGEEVQRSFSYKYNGKNLMEIKNEYVYGRLNSKFRYEYDYY
ncbi:MAG: hypothetical protein A3H98_13175 [Bacteroidetes bacterium RIFCSPLOWO2_02_FULL_36_8]|nr:MAG: hypothetical protein A3H98_13175 [Bacteroidetes bacterium RIFCSPLOWO2_02_FULL_36_8]OFY70246.1 MAG: hypothetical protein A3G23_08875 [Bacteroidetes bacterium RIFCSPLOWO2_12_FULL_37_12]